MTGSNLAEKLDFEIKEEIKTDNSTRVMRDIERIGHIKIRTIPDLVLKKQKAEAKMTDISNYTRVRIEDLVDMMRNLKGVDVDFRDLHIDNAKRARDKIFANKQKIREILAGSEVISKVVGDEGQAVIHDPWPKKIIVDGVTMNMSIKALAEIMIKMHDFDHKLPVFNYNRNEFFNIHLIQSWEFQERIFSSICLAGSDTRYLPHPFLLEDNRQMYKIKTITEAEGKNEEEISDTVCNDSIRATFFAKYGVSYDMIMAKLLHYLIGKKNIGAMKFETMHIDYNIYFGFSLLFTCDGDDFSVFQFNNNEHAGDGSGATVRVSP